jgi:hypothetical protein
MHLEKSIVTRVNKRDIPDPVAESDITLVVVIRSGHNYLGVECDDTCAAQAEQCILAGAAEVTYATA